MSRRLSVVLTVVAAFLFMCSTASFSKDKTDTTKNMKVKQAHKKDKTGVKPGVTPMMKCMHEMGQGPGMMMPGQMGPGMAGPCMMGQGMMGQGMMGQGMMGQGMMGQGMMGQGMMGQGMGFERIGALLKDPKFIKEMELSGEQISKIKKLELETRKALIMSGADLAILNIDLKELIEQDTPDKKDVNAKIDEIGKKQAEIQKFLIDGLLDGKAILTKEQAGKIEKFISGRRQGVMGQGNEMRCPNCPFHKESGEEHKTWQGTWSDKGMSLMRNGNEAGMASDSKKQDGTAPCPFHNKGGMSDRGMSVPESK
jgi:hypothetical protein